MHILGGSFRVAHKLPALVHQNCSVWRIQARCISHANSIQMKYDVYTPASYDSSLSPIVVMHGLFGSRHNWRSVSKLMSDETKRRIYCVDIRNHGDSPHTTEHRSIDLAADLASFVKDQNLEKVCILGHSMGGRGMMVFALNFPHLVDKAIIVDISPISMPRNAEEMMTMLRSMQKAHAPSNASLGDGRKAVRQHLMATGGMDETTANFVLLGFVKTSSGEFKWKMNVATLLNTFPKFRNEQHIQWAPFTGQVLFVCGKKSPYMKPQDWPKIKKIFPNAEIKWLDCGHLIHLDAPSQLIEEIRKFLGR